MPISPDLSPKQGWSYRRFNELPIEVVAAHGSQPDLAAELKTLSRIGIAEFLSPLRWLGPLVWPLLRGRLSDAFIVERKVLLRQSGIDSFFIVIPTDAGFFSVLLNANKTGSREKLERAPEFLAEPMRVAELCGINYQDGCIEIPDVVALRGAARQTGSSLAGWIRGTVAKKATLKFGPRWDWDLYLLSRDEKERWFLFADFGVQGAGKDGVWVSLDASFRDVRKLSDPKAAYEAMLLHYFTKPAEPFDFRPHAVEARSIW